MNNIKWAAIQVLTGGMYLGAEEAIGHPAEWIMSFEGLCDVTYSKKTNEMAGVGNEYNLVKYLEKHNRMVPYYTIHNGMFDIDVNCMDPFISKDNEEQTPDYDNIDIVVGVPVCSGISMVTKASKETKESRNCNMKWMTNYTLTIIKPKIFIFENAPTLMGSRGDELRTWFNQLALDKGYSILYYKTDTVLHHNCQKRPRTFVVFIKHITDNTIENPPLMSFEAASVSLKDYLNKIPKGLSQEVPVKTGVYNYYTLDFINKKFGNDWKTFINGSIMDYINRNSLIDELIEYVKKDEKYPIENKERTLKYFEHIKYKKSLGLNYYGDDIQYVKDFMPSVQFRSMPNMLHLTENRIYNVREYLSFMGMPYDFKLYGDESNLAKIGQNVPVGTAKFIVSQAINILNNWNKERPNISNAVYQNNIKQTTENEES